MFVFNRSAGAVLLPIALLVVVVLWSGRSSTPAADTASAESSNHVTTVAQADQPRAQGS